jgi:lactate dehydrogenase-like 2-hydroxyacid dehydrogenase
MKVLFHYDAGEKLQQKLKKLNEIGLNVVCCPEGLDDLNVAKKFISEIKEAEVIWHVLEPLTKEILEQAPKLKLIQKIGVGTNTIDLEYAQERGISVCNMPGTNSQATAEMALLLIMAASRRLPMMDKACRSGQWRIDKETEESLSEIKGKTVGLVGFGGVAQILADILDAMGATVIYTATQDKRHAKFEFKPLDELLKISDIVSLHAALNPETENLINESSLAQMKNGAILVNTARGALIDELAVYAALLTGKLGAAGFDVFVSEPVLKENKLLSLENVVLAPHLGWLTEETIERSIEVAKQNCQNLKNNEQLIFQVV